MPWSLVATHSCTSTHSISVCSWPCWSGLLNSSNNVAQTLQKFSSVTMTRGLRWLAWEHVGWCGPACEDERCPCQGKKEVGPHGCSSGRSLGALCLQLLTPESSWGSFSVVMGREGICGSVGYGQTWEYHRTSSLQEPKECGWGHVWPPRERRRYSLA